MRSFLAAGLDTVKSGVSGVSEDAKEMVDKAEGMAKETLEKSKSGLSEVSDEANKLSDKAKEAVERSKGLVCESFFVIFFERQWKTLQNNGKCCKILHLNKLQQPF